jgi:hypothetical protein
MWIVPPEAGLRPLTAPVDSEFIFAGRKKAFTAKIGKFRKGREE